ncbi:MAG: hypothetical protein HQ551_02925 [Desulfobacteraceae bacterium]|nr:hypothetical protein [Desulfobacteraceae bacterium]
MKNLDSGACPGPQSEVRLSACDAQAGRNEKKWCFSTFYESIKIGWGNKIETANNAIKKELGSPVSFTINRGEKCV